VKIRGYRIELGEIVACLNQYPGIAASVVVVNAKDEAALIAYVVPVDGVAAGAVGAVGPAGGDLRDFLAARLPDYMIPSRFVAVSGLPLTANGKIDKSALPMPSAENLLAVDTATSAATGAAADGVDLERRIAEMVASLLGVPSVEREDNFFMVGGHSMFGVQLVARIRDTFGVKLTLRQLFGAPTVAALSAEIARLLPSAAAAGN
jgi:acyl carrier protein